MHPQPDLGRDNLRGEVEQVLVRHVHHRSSPSFLRRQSSVYRHCRLRKRAQIFGVTAHFEVQNAKMAFPDERFAPLESAGVIHHSPHLQPSMNEIYRVLEPGGHAAVSIYYLNALHRLWPIDRAIASRPFGGMPGRGRANMILAPSVEKLVRLYDGEANPVGLAFSRKSFEAIFSRWDLKGRFWTAFPTQVFPWILTPMVRAAMHAAPFMIGVVAEKPSDLQMAEHSSGNQWAISLAPRRKSGTAGRMRHRIELPSLYGRGCRAKRGCGCPDF